MKLFKGCERSDNVTEVFMGHISQVREASWLSTLRWIELAMKEVATGQAKASITLSDEEIMGNQKNQKEVEKVKNPHIVLCLDRWSRDG